MENSQASSKILQKEILEQSEKEASAILEQAEKEKNRILQEAREEADKITARTMKKAESEADTVRRRILSGVHLEIKQKSLQQREVLISRIMERVENKLDDLRKSKKYLPFLENMILEGLIALDVQKVEIQAGDVEKKILKQQVITSIQKKYKKQCGKDVTLTVRNEILSEAGLIIEDDKRRVKFDNRFTARIQRMQNDLRFIILKKLETQ